MAKLESKGNSVTIEGILSEVNLNEINYNKNGRDNKAISGTITVRVEQKIYKTDAEPTIMEVPIQIFVAELKNDLSPNPAYENISRVMNDYVSIAASDINHADCVRITRASIRMNEYYGQSDKLVSFPRINASFVTKIKREDCKPKAEFDAVFAVGAKGYETDAQGVETDRYCVTGILPQYGGSVDVVKFYTESKNVIDTISQYWEEETTVHAIGKLNFSSITQVVEVPVDFGDPIEKKTTRNVSDLIITGGTAAPFEGEFAYDYEDIAEALKVRKARLADLKEKSKNKVAKKTAPKATSYRDDLGF